MKDTDVDCCCRGCFLLTSVGNFHNFSPFLYFLGGCKKFERFSFKEYFFFIIDFPLIIYLYIFLVLNKAGSGITHANFFFNYFFLYLKKEGPCKPSISYLLLAHIESEIYSTRMILTIIYEKPILAWRIVLKGKNLEIMGSIRKVLKGHLLIKNFLKYNLE